MYFNQFSVLFCVLLSIACSGQKSFKNDSVRINFLFGNPMVQDSNDLTIKVIYTNLSQKNVEVYQELFEGDKGDRFFNVNAEVEKKHNSGHLRHPLRFYQNPLLYDMEERYRHYDLPKKQLSPQSSDTLKLNLLAIAKTFFPGEYRLKVHLRIQTIQDLTDYTDINFEKAPPMDTLIYTSSNWIYFKVRRELTARR